MLLKNGLLIFQAYEQWNWLIMRRFTANNKLKSTRAFEWMTAGAVLDYDLQKWKEKV